MKQAPEGRSKSIERVYQYWETLENLPDFMANVEEVIPTDTDITHWRVKGPFGRTVEYEATTTQREPNRAIGWNTVEGELGTSGQVRFEEVAPGRTRVEVTMNYADPPGGRVGEVASRAVANPKVQLEQDLPNLKELLEGKATPEETQRRPAATTVQSGMVALVAGGAAVVLVLGVGVVVFLVVRRRGSQPQRKRRLAFKF